MNYLKIYCNLMRKALTRKTVEGYSEKHHIFPQSVFGLNEQIVRLSAKEHFISHFLLWKLYKKRYGEFDYRTKKMGYAFNQMAWNGPNHQRHISRSFVYARQFSSLMISGDRNPSKLSEVREKISKSKTGKSRPDLLGKKYFGASDESVRLGLERMSKSKTGQKIDYPTDRKSSPCSAEKAQKISEARKQTKLKFINMSSEEFDIWVLKHTKTNSGRINGNVSRAIKWRNEC